MDFSTSARTTAFVVPAAARISALLLAVLGIFFCNNATILAAILLFGIVPWLYRVGGGWNYLRFVAFVLAPIATALLVVWGLLVKAPPGEPMGSSPSGGMLYAAIVSLRLAVLSGLFQALFQGLKGNEMLRSLREWGVSGDLLVIALATFAMVPEGKLRAEQVLMSRSARGLIGKRGWLNSNRQLPFILRPMLGWALRSAVQRAELWHHRGLLERLNTPCIQPLLGGTRNISDDVLAARAPSLHPQECTSSSWICIGSFHEFACEIRPGTISALVGANFSGRTDALRMLVGLQELPAGEVRVHGDGAYVGPETHASMSGLAHTVADELALYMDRAGDWAAVSSLVELFGLTSLATRNPTTLSGGEQASLALTCAAARKPSVLAVDCAFEQLDVTLRTRFMTWLSECGRNLMTTVIADNRFDELLPDELQVLNTIAEIDGWLSGAGESCLQVEPISVDTLTYRRSANPFTLRAEKVAFAYKKASQVLNGVDLELKPGSIYILEGPNGVGKSTLAKLLCGVQKPNSGAFFRDGHLYRPWDTPGRDVAYHFQNPDVQLFETSVTAEVTAGAVAHGMTPDALECQTRQLLEVFGLALVSNKHPLDLPFVLRKRVAMAATLASGCPWMILDEPTLGQDRQSVDGIAKLLDHLTQAGNGVIVISHSAAFKSKLANAIRITVSEGRILVKGEE
jgi:energy-coupling factor transport system ATP-binding protein